MNRGDLEGRFDCLYYLLNKPKSYKTIKLKQYLVDVFQGQVQGELETNLIKVLKVKNLNLFGDINFENVTYINDISKRKLLLNDDILTPFRGQTIFTKKFAYFESNEKVTIDNNLGVIRLNKELILPKFFYYYISSDIGFQEILKNIVGAGIPALTKRIISELNIPILSKDTQQNIIDIMDNAYKRKKQKEQEAKDLLDGIDDYLLDKLGITLPDEPENNIENRTFRVGFEDVFSDRLDANSYTQYYQNIFNALETSITTLKTITKKIKTGTTPNQKLNPYTKDKESIPFLRNSDIQNGEIISNKFKYIKSELSKHLTFSYKDEIIICIAGTIGITALNTYEKLSINQNVSSLTIDKSKINLNFLMNWLNTEVAINLMKRLASIATISYINNPTLLKLQIPIPDIKIQHEIVKEISKRRHRARKLNCLATKVLEKAKEEVEKIILGKNYGT